jgi:hypothetical protein
MVLSLKRQPKHPHFAFKTGTKSFTYWSPISANCGSTFEHRLDAGAMGAISRKATVVTALGVVLVVVVWYVYSSHELHLPSSLSAIGIATSTSGRERLAKYCNIEIPERRSYNHSIDDDWELQYLAVNIRHGDRSAIHRLPGTITPGNGISEVDNVTAASPYIEKLRTFQLSALPGSEKRFNSEQVRFSIPASLIK